MIDRLNNWEAYKDSLQHLSLIAVLLATAAFVGFAQSPSQADAFTSAGLDPAYPVPWLRAFFMADLITFALATGVVMLAQLHVSTLPFDVGESDRVSNKSREDYERAIRIWRQHFLLLGILGAAVVSGFATFFFAGAAVYPHKHVFTDLLPYFLIPLTLVAVIAWQWANAMKRLKPEKTFMWDLFPCMMYADLRFED
jgi:hypothetical protein